MTKINVFDNYEEVQPILLQYLDENMKAKGEYHKITQTKLEEYKTKTSWYEKVEEEAAKSRTSLMTDPRTGEKIEVTLLGIGGSRHLSEKENEEFCKMYPNLGQGLELKCTICLQADDENYFFNAGIMRPDFPEYESEDYSSIKELVNKVHKFLEAPNNAWPGAKITPYLYTVKGEEKINEEEKSEFRTLLEMIFPKEESIKDLTPEEKVEVEGLREGIKKLDNGSINILSRGLTQQEREEFERLYSK